MRQIVTVLIACLIALSISGCWEEKVFLRCKTPNVQKPVLDNEPKQNILENVKKCIKNNLLLKEYALKLEEANKVCK